jgi:hypothetical protein
MGLCWSGIRFGFPIDTLEKIATSTDWKTTAKLFVPALSASGFVDGKKVKEFLYTFYGDKNIEDLPIPLRRRLPIYRMESCMSFIRAAFWKPYGPVFRFRSFYTVQHDNAYLVDGGLLIRAD